MKPKKTKIKKDQPTWPLHSSFLVNFFYTFLITLSVVYGVLIWSAGEMFKDMPDPPKGEDTQTALRKKVQNLVGGYPMERMASYISKEDKKTAAFLVGVAKKESNWGKFSPKKNGKECYNYWGYRGTYNQTYSGYSCFDSPKQAVAVVGQRMRDLAEKDIDTPEKLVVWKCGWSEECSNTPEAKKWIKDVGLYYKKF